MKSVSFCLLFLSVNFLFSQIKLKSPQELMSSTIHISSQTPVKDQGNGNSCSAFGVAAALETLPNMPKDISENFLYTAQKYEQFDTNNTITRGTFLKAYVTSLPKYGILTEAELPYPQIAASKWEDHESETLKILKESPTGPVTFIYKYKSIAKFLNLDSYEYMDRMQSKNIERIKCLLDNGVKAIPVSYELYMPAWEKFQATKYTTITPDKGYCLRGLNQKQVTYSNMKKAIVNLNDKINSGEIVLERTVVPTKNYNPYGGHVVAIVGYDSEGFIIKNSWGTDWRYYGYERISYDYHELFAYEALALKKVSFKN